MHARDDVGSVMSGFTTRTTGTMHTRASQPDHTRLPAEYAKVIDVLRKRGEKAHMIMATHEVRRAQGVTVLGCAGSADYSTAVVSHI